MDQNEIRDKIARSRAFMTWSDDGYESDQMLKKPQPPLVKAPFGGEKTLLPRSFDELPLNNDILRVLYARRSHRVYTGEKMTLLTLSFLIWAQQGVRGIRGKKYATLRTVPSGGARHPFELYVTVLSCEGLAPGHYHYLPMDHALELLHAIDPADPAERKAVSDGLCGQDFALKANVIFWYGCVPYRGEWRYSYDSHRVMLIDAGHVTQNLYIACSALSLGTCAIAAVVSDKANALFDLDGKEEYVFYSAPVGTVSSDNEDMEQEFYAFLRDEE